MSQKCRIINFFSSAHVIFFNPWKYLYPKYNTIYEKYVDKFFPVEKMLAQFFSGLICSSAVYNSCSVCCVMFKTLYKNQPVGVCAVFVTIGLKQTAHVSHRPVRKVSPESCVINMHFPVGRATHVTSTPTVSWNKMEQNSEYLYQQSQNGHINSCSNKDRTYINCYFRISNH